MLYNTVRLLQSLNYIVALKVEYKVAHGSITQQYAHKNANSAERGLSGQWAFTSKKSNDRSPNMGIWVATVSLKSSGKYVGKSEKLTVFLSPFSHLSTQTAKRKKKHSCFKDGSDCNQNGRRHWESQAHSLDMFLGLSEIDTSNTFRMTFTKVSCSQSNCENANQVHRILCRVKFRQEQEQNARVKSL